MLFLLTMLRKPLFIILSILLLTGSDLFGQDSHEQQIIRSIATEKNKKKRFSHIMTLGQYYKENNIDRADSIRSVIVRESRNFEDSIRFGALFYNAEVALILGDLDEYHNTILACQPFLNKLKSPGIQFKVYRHLGYYHSNQQEYETAKFYLKLSLKKALHLRDVSKQSEAYRYLGLNYMNSNQKDSALYYTDKAISTGRRSGNKAVLSQAFNVKAEVYEFFGQIELSVAKNFISRQLAEEINNHLLLAKYYREIGYSQKQIYNLKDAEKNFRKSLEHSRLIYDKRQMALALTNLASVQLDKKQFKKAIANSQRSILYLTDLNDLNGLGETHNILGMVYQKQNDYTKASNNFNQALIYYESTSNREKMAGVYHNVGTVFKERGKYTTALNYLNRSVEIREQYGAKNQIYNTYRVIADVYKDIDNTAESLKYMELYLNYIDSNTILQAANKIAELSESYNSAQREKINSSLKDSLIRQGSQKEVTATRLENSQLRNNFQMYIIIAFIIIIVMAGLIIFYGWNQTKIKQQRKEAEMSQTLLRTQMNPHFVFNAMSVIQSYIFDHDTENSSKFLVNFSRLMRLILENSPKEHIPIPTEVEILEKYLSMQKLRFQERFEYSIDANFDLYDESANIPPMITQPFIENAIEHGQLHTVEGGFISVTFTKSEGMLIISIVDNGVGRKGSSINKKSSAHKSMAMEITRDRIENLNKKYKTDGSLVVEDYNKELEIGTKVLISLPYTTESNR